MLLEGQRIDRYSLIRLLGSGGMGEVYLAEDARIAQHVAIKVIRTETSSYGEGKRVEEAARLFLREARAITKLDHPNPIFYRFLISVKNKLAIRLSCIWSC